MRRAPLGRRGLLAAAIATAAAGPAPARPSGWAEALERHLRPLLARHGMPGMAVGLLAGGRRHVFTFGRAAPGDGPPVTARTLFEIGSVSKVFTATLAAWAEARGRLDLGAHPGRYAPALRGRPIDAATLRQLGTYTAGGLPLQFPDDVTSDAEALRYLAAWRPSAPPGTRRRYSNPSIGLLGHLAGQALGSDYTAAAEGALFPALGLTGCHIRVPAAAAGDQAWGLDAQGRPARVSPGAFDAAAYGVKASADSLLDFLAVQLEPEALEADLRQAIATTRTGLFRVGPMVQGLGWEQYPWPVPLTALLDGNSAAMALEEQPAHPLPGRGPAAPETLFNKTGSTRGFGAYLAFVPARRIGIALLANRNWPIPDRIRAAHAVLAEMAAGG